MDSDMYLEKSTCCIESTGTSIDPSSVKDTICAGSVSGDYGSEGCMLAKIYFPKQSYIAGFKPDKALCNGTMFPELVRIFK